MYKFIPQEMEQKFPVLIPKDKYISYCAFDGKDVTIKFSDKKKIALLFISLNAKYWPYLTNIINDAKIHFLPHHNVDYLIWSDMPKDVIFEKSVIFPTEAVEWPMPTLMRYHLFLQQEKKLKDYDYIFYLDADMRIVDFIGDEILGEGLTVAEHPMYALRKEYVPPYEPNVNSAAYVQRVGQVINDEGKPRFKPLYAAGGFQGGETKIFIEAMKVMKKNIDKDFVQNYVAIWNDESHWNKYLFDYNGPMLILSPSYVYPDSLIKEYYEPIWGKSLPPKIITLTKPFTLSKEGGAHIRQFLGTSNKFICPVCRDILEMAGYQINSVVECLGSGKPHQTSMTKL